MILNRTSTFLIAARVKHSQKLSAAPVKPWVAMEQQGVVVCAHCTGLGEACSHIAALLFTVETNTQLKKRTAYTSLPCSWLPPTFRSVPDAQLCDVDFRHYSRKGGRVIAAVLPVVNVPLLKRLSLHHHQRNFVHLTQISARLGSLCYIHFGQTIVSQTYSTLYVRGVIPRPCLRRAT